ncbi:conserved hypothetical protein [Deferribacter desulfuricans SSM1]|uniref:Prepilin-type N-terminal cleavage/methylation domain-containing protein n=1 Tax=Deferribacter desulfuricans (strain DSM 14783 / JCM 11476 / NBRC 101012 / SSM1) TaxID=639282 RepID=D3PDV6_DEFDS|nr:hypothetical protein [Deferribacter desulfuricans]BAI80779.1 conserved hypothetical protein [Deferribacter desulfuricans SSM1]
MNLELKTGAFTFIELLIIIVIFGLSLMFITPKIAAKFSGLNPVEAGINNIINIAFLDAQKTKKPVFIKGIKGTNKLFLDNKSYEIKDIESFQTVEINEINQPGLDFYIGVYPKRFVDSFKIETNNGIIKSNSLGLTCEFSKK